MTKILKIEPSDFGIKVTYSNGKETEYAKAFFVANPNVRAELIDAMFIRDEEDD